MACSPCALQRGDERVGLGKLGMLKLPVNSRSYRDGSLYSKSSTQVSDERHRGSLNNDLCRGEEHEIIVLKGQRNYCRFIFLNTLILPWGRCCIHLWHYYACRKWDSCWCWDSWSLTRSSDTTQILREHTTSLASDHSYLYKTTGTFCNSFTFTDCRIVYDFCLL